MTQFNRATLAKILELLSSEHSGEVVAAARLATTMIREAGLTWDDVLAEEIRVQRPAPPSPLVQTMGGRAYASGHYAAGPMGMRRQRELSSHEQFFMLLLSPRTPNDVKSQLKGWEARVLDGEITPQEKLDLVHLFRQFVA